MTNESINDLDELSHEFAEGFCEFCGSESKLEWLGFVYCIDCAEEALDEARSELEEAKWEVDSLSALIEENKDG